MKWLIGVIVLAVLSLFLNNKNSFSSVVNNEENNVFSVYISGSVQNEGWYDYQKEITAQQLIDMAGGLTDNADSCTVDSTISLLHKQKVYISENNNELKINLNIANKEQLMTIKGIGEKTAQNILDYRNQINRFNNIYQLLEVRGIGEKTLIKFWNHLCVT